MKYEKNSSILNKGINFTGITQQNLSVQWEQGLEYLNKVTHKLAKKTA